MKYCIYILFLFLFACSTSKQAYLFTSFHEPASEGLRLLYSEDGYKWRDMDTVFVKPAIGKDKIMRDPSIACGPDGTFHLVWTTEWKGGNGFGYTHSKDLRHWSEQRYIPVMAHEPSVVNVWAPELFYDDEAQEFVIIWASTLPYRFEKGIEDEHNNHRMYYTTTKDFVNFSPTRLFFDPGFSVIDAVIVKVEKGKYVLVLKDNTRPNRNLKVAFSDRATGPYTEVSAPFSENFTEGPTVAKVGDSWLIYFDAYQSKRYGAVRTRDFKSFERVDSLVDIPKGHKHGTIFRIDKKQWKQ